MKDLFQSKPVPREPRTIWRYLSALILLFSLSINQMWGAYDVPADGTVTLSQKVNSGGRFNVEASGVYHFRTSSGYSWDSSNGIKTQSNEGGVVFYLDASKEIEVGIVHTEAKNAHDVTVHVYSITESVYKQFDDNKAGAAESNRTFSTAPTSSTDGSFTISITAESKTFTGKKTLAAGYYAVVPVGEKSKTFFKTIKFTTTGGGTDVCPSGLSISGTKDYTEGDKIELTAALTAGNGTITYQWYKGSVAAGNAISGATTNKLTINSCAVADAGNYYCVASKTSCDDVTSSAFAITVAADTKCFNMPEITSKPSDLAHVTVTGGTLSDVSTAKAVAMNAAGLKLDGNYVYLKVSLASASIVEGTKITVAWKSANSGAGLALVNENLESKVIDASNVATAGSVSHTFTAEEAANYADEFIIHRNASGAGIYVNAITVENCGPALTKRTITLNYNDGVTPNGSIKVVDGKAANKPADPERGKYTFLGWNNGASAYNWATPVTADLTLTAQWQDPWTISFNADGGSEVADITVKHNTKAEKPDDPTKEDHDFDGWFIGDTDNEFDWDAKVTANYSLKAHWSFNVAKYDIEYYDGETKIGTEEQVRVDQHPTAAGIETNKLLMTFDGWFLSAALTGDPVDLNDVTPSEGLKLYGKWSKAYAANIDFEAFIDAHGTSGDWASELADKHYAISNTAGVSLDNQGTSKPADKGLKMKEHSGEYVSFNVNADKLVLVKMGRVNGMAASVDGGANYTALDGAESSAGASVVNYLYNAAEAEYRLKTTDNAYNIIQSITITNPYQVSFDANGGDPVAPQYGTPKVTLPSATNGTQNFAGWYTSGDEFVGMADAEYMPTADITLVAHWEALSTVNTLSDLKVNDVTVDGFDPDVHTYRIVLPYGTDVNNLPKITLATPTNENATVAIYPTTGPAWTEDYDGGCYRQQANVTPQDPTAAVGYNDIRITIAPKDGVEIIRAEHTGAKTAAVSGAIGGETDKNTQADSKLGDANHYFGIKLAEGTFEAGDVLKIHATTPSVAVRIYSNKGETRINPEDGSFNSDNLFTYTLTEATEWIYLYRKLKDGETDMNPKVDYMSVTRIMMPELTAISFNGVAATKSTTAENTFSVTLPAATTDLADMTIVPTIIRNAAHATTPEAVVSNEGAWVEGDNTYRVMDKDGDKTDYTINITLIGAAETPVITADPASQAYCAGSEPTLTVTANVPNDGGTLHYAWYKKGETDTKVGSDAASYTIESAGTYYVKVTNSKAGSADATVTSENAIVTMNVAAAITTQPTGHSDVVSGSEVTLSVVATNATGYQWYICDDAEKTNAAAISGAEAANYVFNCTASAYYYCVVGNACGEGIESNVVSIKLEPAGCNMIASIPDAEPYQYEQTGEWTLYGIDSNGRLNGSNKFVSNAKDFDDNTVNAIADQRVGMIFDKDVESITLYATASGTGRTWKSDQQIRVTSDDITSGSPVYTNVTATREVSTMPGNTKQYVFTANDMIIPAGKKAWLPFSGSITIFKICYTAALAEPKLPTLSNQELCAGAAYQTFDASITNAAACEGTVSYKWYDVDDPETPVATTATFTPSAEGTYYVVVTHSATGHITRTAQSAELSVAHYEALSLVSYSEDVFQHMGTAATLSVVATGKNVAYAWYTCSSAAGADAEAIDPAETEASLTIAAIEEGVHYYKVVISHDCDETTLSHVFKVEGWDQIELQDVTGNMTWDFSKANDGTAAESNLCNDEVLANVAGIVNNSDFESDNIKATANKFSSGKLQASMIMFHTTVGGIVTVVFSHTGKNKTDGRALVVNGTYQSELSHNQTAMTYACYVPAGDVVLTSTTGDGGAMLNVTSVDFKVKAAPDYSRNVSNNIGTLCVDHNVLVGGALGATFYQIASRNEQYNDKIDFEEVLPNEELKAGEPYIFKSTTGKIELFYGETAVTEPEPVRGMHGWFDAVAPIDPTKFTMLDITEENKSDILYIAQNKLWNCEDLVTSNLKVVNNRAYIVMSDVPTYAEYQASLQPQQGAAQRRRVTIGGDKVPEVATGMDNLNESETPVKVLINGQIFILRGEKIYDATGRLVK